ncbi:MAG: hypothetical protein EZS28_012472 [Streblomastix strix]|uniref:Uncharacterized protein n=1 Tax=Streblomastix strix TaxID=222440 RepID=A0A5J4WBF4_9EUKA|nr:MAG: hypothetical protein EZS28_012472 [Streblomastix strix]
MIRKLEQTQETLILMDLLNKHQLERILMLSGDIEDIVGVQIGEKLDGIDSAGIIIEYIYNNTGAKHFHRAYADFFRIHNKKFNPFEQSPLTSLMAYFDRGRRWQNDQEIKRKEALLRNQCGPGASKRNLVRPQNQSLIQDAVQTPLRANLQTPHNVEIEFVQYLRTVAKNVLEVPSKSQIASEILIQLSEQTFKKQIFSLLSSNFNIKNIVIMNSKRKTNSQEITKQSDNSTIPLRSVVQFFYYETAILGRKD